jgi:hypothetical protein
VPCTAEHVHMQRFDRWHGVGTRGRCRHTPSTYYVFTNTITMNKILCACLLCTSTTYITCT